MPPAATRSLLERPMSYVPANAGLTVITVTVVSIAVSSDVTPLSSERDELVGRDATSAVHAHSATAEAISSEEIAGLPKAIPVLQAAHCPSRATSRTLGASRSNSKRRTTL